MILTHANYCQLLAVFPAEELLTATPSPKGGLASGWPWREPAAAAQWWRFEEVADAAGISKDDALDAALTAWIAEQRDVS